MNRLFSKIIVRNQLSQRSFILDGRTYNTRDYQITILLALGPTIQNETDMGKNLTYLCDIFNYDQGILTIFVIWMGGSGIFDQILEQNFIFANSLNWYKEKIGDFEID